MSLVLAIQLPVVIQILIVQIWVQAIPALVENVYFQTNHQLPLSLVILLNVQEEILQTA